MRAWLNTMCPYCGYVQRTILEVHTIGQQKYIIVICDVDEGGCDIPYAVKCTPILRTDGIYKLTEV